MAGLVLKRFSRLVCTGPVCTDEFKPRLSVVGAKKSELNKSFDAV